MGTGGGAALWWDTINHFKGFKSSNLPFGGERTGFFLRPAGSQKPRDNRRCRRSIAGASSPGHPRPPAQSGGVEEAGRGQFGSAEDPAVLQHKRAPRPDEPGRALFPFSASGTGLSAEAGRAGGLAARGLAETRAPCDLPCKKGRG